MSTTHEHSSHAIHHEHPDDVGERNRLGVILLLVADISFALSMIFVFFYLKSQNVNDMWLPKADGENPAIKPLSSVPAWTVTGIAAIGFILHYMGLKSARLGHQSSLKIFGALSFLFACGGAVYQWQTIANAGYAFYQGAYVSAFYLITIMNQVHLILTVLISLGNWNRARLGLYKSNYWHVDIVNIWWLWMTVSSALGAFCLSMA